MCVCLRTCVCGWLCTERSDAGVFFSSPTYCFRQSLALNLEDPEPDNSARLVDQKALRILLFPLSVAGIVGEFCCSKLRFLGVGDPSQVCMLWMIILCQLCHIHNAKIIFCNIITFIWKLRGSFKYCTVSLKKDDGGPLIWSYIALEMWLLKT